VVYDFSQTLYLHDDVEKAMSNPAGIEGISAVTLATHDMARAVRFYRTLGFEVVHGDNSAGFTSFRAGHS
jgi:catechol-2,3-dioxygenase